MAVQPPATASRLEELERKFNENPRRYFAPLANEYRKAGKLEQAIAICRTYVPQQPAHMSGQIVFGQVLYEAGEFDEARTVLEAALTLDPENLIALRHLGDIARARGEPVDARKWYQRVLDADPRNPDALAAIMGLAPTGEAAVVPPTPEHTEPATIEVAPPAMPADESSSAFVGAAPSRPADEVHEDVPVAAPFATVEPENPEPDTIDTTPVEFVTETMAELYLQQGFKQEALDVYHKLLARTPDDEMLHARVESLEKEMHPAPPVEAIAPRSMREFLKGLTNRHLTKPMGMQAIPAGPIELESIVEPSPLTFSATPRDAASIAATEYDYEQSMDFTESGVPSEQDRVSLDALFSSTTEVTLPDEPGESSIAEAYTVELVHEEPPAPPMMPGVRPAGDELSLDHIFGDADGAGPAQALSDDLGFDELFGTIPAALTSPASSPSEKPDAPPPAMDGTDLSDGIDAEQFTDWLSGLKKEVKVAVLNGPNLNLLGVREPAIYGTTTLADIERRLHEVAREISVPELSVTVECAQHNSEGAMIDAIQALRGTFAGAIINAGAYSHTSLAIRDAFASVSVPYVEVHLSNIYAREPERRHSMLAAGARAVLVGFGAQGYEMALRGLVTLLRADGVETPRG